MKPDDAVPDAAKVIFGDSVSSAAAYRESLASAGVERGLIGPREVDRLWDRHVLNCAVIADAFEEGASVVDVGSGAGLPGIPLAIARPDLALTLVEPLLRRATFLQEVVDELGLENVRVVRGRAEEKAVRKECGSADAVTSRAVAPLDRLARWCTPLLRVGGRLVALKGSSAQTEIDTHRDTLSKLGLTQIQVKVFGADRVETPSTVVVAVRRDPSGARCRHK